MDKIEQIWLYLHQQLPPAEREAFETRLTQDAGLRTELEREQEFHLLVREALAEKDQHGQDVAERILTALEHEIPGGRASSKAGSVPTLRFPSRRTQAVGGFLALAASLLVALGLYNQQTSQIIIQPSGFLAASYRDGSAKSTTVSQQVLECDLLLRSELQRQYFEYRARRPWLQKVIRPVRWQVAVEWREMPPPMVVLNADLTGTLNGTTVAVSDHIDLSRPLPPQVAEIAQAMAERLATGPAAGPRDL